MSSPRNRPSPSATEYVYRRDLEPRELLPAMGVGLGVGLAAFYVARLFLQRTPLDVRGSRNDLRSHRAGEG
ncbi:MAG: hypothetical protein ACYC2G_02425 [Gemmatimonadaceae bacterium]